MKPLNYKERKINLLQFALVFGIMLLIMFLTGYLTLKTGKLGVDVLEKKHSLYSEVFRKKASLNYDLEEIIKRLYQINNKDRNLSQHKKFQDLISDVRDNIIESIKDEERPEEFVFYQEIADQIKAIQSDLDTYEEDSEKYVLIEELLERCKEKYIEEQAKKKK
jgi:hypothetical protein